MKETIDQPDSAKKLLAPFIQHLLKTGVISPLELPKILRFRSQIDPRIGTLAALKGYMTLANVFNVIAEQAVQDKEFGKLAIELGFLKIDQVEEILELQKNPLRMFLETLEIMKIIDPEILYQNLNLFLDNWGKTSVSSDSSTMELAKSTADKLSKRPSKDEIEEIRNALRQVKELSSLPQIITHALRALEQPTTNMEDVTNILLADQVMTAQILRLVNSAFYGNRGKVSTLRKALITLGTKATRQAVLTVQVLNQFKNLPKKQIEGIWWHTTLTSQWAHALADRQGITDREKLEEILVAGLIHDVGKPVILQKFPEAWKDIELEVLGGNSLLAAESRILGMNHAEIGAFLCQLWKFPPALVEAIQFHHSPISIQKHVPEIDPIRRFVHASCRLAELIPDRSCWNKIKTLDKEFLTYHDLTKERILEMVPSVYHEAQKIRTLINI